ncbi:YhgE/Pip domain-containing protein [Subtercola vilae]|uniref:YhgE/Pip domain-containing protein n=1 Tax=Subtercola vilae TaxID=2056433 RepID=A0A4T2C4U4_9MICO|nr:YhgE/Pip domain-containing protein [Subtercola vilae]TIH38719.1 YhgE/Pip domain-containing protein [Subtercola vilae]
MKIVTLVRTEFRRLTATGLARLALVALMLVPVIYAGLYLWANSDPYGNVKNIPVALVVEDQGATLNGAAVNYGTQVRDQLVADGSVKWIDASASDAATGIKNGTYDFILTLGPDFSKLLTSSGTATPEQAVVQLTTNDTNSFLASTIAATVAEKVRLSISQQVGEAAALQFLNGFSTIHDNLATAVSGANSLADGTTQAQTGAASLASGAATANTGAQALASGAAEASAGASTLSTGAQTAANGASALASGASKTNDGAQVLSSGLSSLQSQSSSLPAQTAALAAGAAQVAAGNKTLASDVGVAAGLAQAAADQVPTARADIVNQLTALGLTAEQQAPILAQLDQVGTAINNGNDQVKTAQDQVNQLSSGANQVAAGTQKLADAAPALSAGIASAASGAAQVASGTQQVSTGASSLATGTAQLATGAAALASANQQLSDGATTLAGGTQQLADGSSTLATGATQLNTGAAQLRDGLVSGEAQVPNYSADQRQAAAATIATPARVDTDTVTKATTYGAGMAPFFISLAAWIGIYALFLIIKPLSRRALTAIKAPLRVVAAGWLAPALLGAVQMAAVYFVVTVLLGFTVANPALMLLFMMFTSVTFVAIILALNVWLGSVGQFLGLVLMVLQLVTAGGTFPWQTLPGPLGALHHALPMSYAVDGIRQLMYGGDLSLALNDVGVIAVWLLGALAFTYFLAGRTTRSRTLRDLRPSLIG